MRPLFSGTDCSGALNKIANGVVYGLGGTSFSGAASTDLQAAIRDGVLEAVFYAFYGFEEDVSLVSADLQAALDFSETLTALASGTYYDKVSLDIQAERTATLIPAAEAAAREAYIVSTPSGLSGYVTENAVPASTVAAATTTTWTANSEIYVVNSITVNGVLAIEPGTVVYLAGGANITVASTGSIQAAGTLDNPVVFTRAASGAWGSIIINSMSNSFSYCDISGGTIGVDVNGLVDISNSNLHGHQTSAMDCSGAVIDVETVSTVTENYFYSNGSYPVKINQYTDFDDSNHFYDPAAETEPDPDKLKNGIYFYGDVDRAVDFTVSEVPYVIEEDPWNINVSGSLTIDPGVIVKLWQDAYRVRVYSQIYAEGTENEPIVFTSYAEDIGGDTNGIGAVTPGNWGGLDIIGAGSQFSYCQISYAETGLDFNEALNDQGSAVISNCWFHDNLGVGLDGTEAMTGTSVTSSSFWDNGSWPVKINQYMAFNNSNHFYDPDAQTEPDFDKLNNGIYFFGDVDQAVVLTVTEVPYFIEEDPWYINTSGSLTVEAGAVIKLWQANYGVRVYSSITALGTAEAPIMFTSYADDAGGNTNGETGTAAAGDWMFTRYYRRRQYF